jgi:hypothetical protein
MLVLEPHRIELLRVHADARIRNAGCDHSLRFSHEWADSEGVDWDDLLY